MLDSTYKTNKYWLPFIKFVGVTSTELTFSIAFAYIISKKEDNIFWTCERCFDQLHSKYISPKVIVTDRDDALINVVDTFFPEDNTLLSEYHIGRNVGVKCKTDCKVKDLKSNDGKEIKSSEAVKTIMVAWEAIMNSDTEQAYIDNCNRFKIVSDMFLNFLNMLKLQFCSR